MAFDVGSIRAAGSLPRRAFGGQAGAGGKIPVRSLCHPYWRIELEIGEPGAAAAINSD